MPLRDIRKLGAPGPRAVRYRPRHGSAVPSGVMILSGGSPARVNCTVGICSDAQVGFLGEPTGKFQSIYGRISLSCQEEI